MSAFSLQIVTPDGLHYDGEAEKLLVRTVTGDVCILAHHCDYVTALGMGEAQVVMDGQRRRAACIGGMLSVTGNRVRLVPTTFEWAEDIDAGRAAASEAQAQETLARADCTEQEKLLAQAQLKRAQVRMAVTGRK